MNKLLLLLGTAILMAGLLVGGASWADDEDWERGCQGNMDTSQVSPGGFVCLDIEGNGESKMLSVTQCDNFDVEFFPDLAGTADDGTTVQIYVCGNPTDASGDDPPDGTWSATGVCWILENVTLDGDPATNTEAVYGAAAEWIYSLAAGWTNDEPRVIVRCNLGP